MRRFLALLLLVCGSCAAPSEEEVRAEFGSFVEKHNACADASECALIYPGCPLGCYVPINVESAEKAKAKAKELIDDYQSGGQACAADCLEATPLACVNHKCELTARQ
jgi:hypothetical protein